MSGPDMSTPRRLGQFYIVINPDVFVPRPIYEAGMIAYLADLRSTPARPGARVMAPGDREWDCLEERSVRGIPVAPAHIDEFRHIAAESGLDAALLAPA